MKIHRTGNLCTDAGARLLARSGLLDVDRLLSDQLLIKCGRPGDSAWWTGEWEVDWSEVAIYISGSRLSNGEMAILRIAYSLARGELHKALAVLDVVNLGLVVTAITEAIAHDEQPNQEILVPARVRDGLEH